MKFANVDGLKREAQPNLRGQCRDCNTLMIAKCGDHKLWHWAHYRKSDCDHWWESETPWHREWKNEFLEDWQEVRHSAPDGEVHRADVKTEKGNVLEFQNSAISASERVSRENFYRPMNWVVNGTSYKRDLPSFQRALGLASLVSFAPVRLSMSVQGCPIIERWAGGLCPVYLDFGDAVFDLGYPIRKLILWRLDYLKQINRVIVTPVSRSSFIDHHCNKGPLGLFKFPRPTPLPTPQTRLPGFEHYLRQQEARRRKKFAFL